MSGVGYGIELPYLGGLELSLGALQVGREVPQHATLHATLCTVYHTRNNPAVSFEMWLGCLDGFTTGPQNDQEMHIAIGIKSPYAYIALLQFHTDAAAEVVACDDSSRGEEALPRGVEDLQMLRRVPSEVAQAPRCLHSSANKLEEEGARGA